MRRLMASAWRPVHGARPMRAAHLARQAQCYQVVLHATQQEECLAAAGQRQGVEPRKARKGDSERLVVLRSHVEHRDVGLCSHDATHKTQLTLIVVV
jgi:hypothetical protein